MLAFVGATAQAQQASPSVPQQKIDQIVKLLDDPKHIYGQDRDLNIVSANFRTQHPRATAFLSRYTLTDKQLSQMLAWVDVDKMTDAQAVDRFIKENEALIWYMIGGLSPDIKKPASLN